MIVLTPSEWSRNIKPRLIQEYGARIMISWVCRRELGFTVREHQGWQDNPNYRSDMTKYHNLLEHRGQDWYLRSDNTESDLGILLSGPPSRGNRIPQVCLDFYDHAHETFFRLKYL